MSNVDKLIVSLAHALRPALVKVRNPDQARRPDKKALYAALKKVRPLIEARYGKPVRCRYSGSPPDQKSSYGTGGHVFKVIEYLWDFSLSRYAIPQAIEARSAKAMNGGKFELLFVAESELGTKDEICRDLLKLLDARTSIRCLIYRQPKRCNERRDFEARMIRILHRHAYFDKEPGRWLFVGLTWTAGTVSCDTYTLSEHDDRFILVP